MVDQLLAVARLRFRCLQASRLQQTRCIIQAAAANCWPRAEAAASASAQPPCGQNTQAVSHVKSVRLAHQALASAQQTGRGSEANCAGAQIRRSARRKARTAGLRLGECRVLPAGIGVACAGTRTTEGRDARIATDASAVSASSAGRTKPVE